MCGVKIRVLDNEESCTAGLSCESCILVPGRCSVSSEAGKALVYNGRSFVSCEGGLRCVPSEAALS